MVSLDDVYRKFGEASEAAQLLETEQWSSARGGSSLQGLFATPKESRNPMRFQLLTAATPPLPNSTISLTQPLGDGRGDELWDPLLFEESQKRPEGAPPASDKLSTEPGQAQTTSHLATSRQGDWLDAAYPLLAEFVHDQKGR